MQGCGEKSEVNREAAHLLLHLRVQPSLVSELV